MSEMARRAGFAAQDFIADRWQVVLTGSSKDAEDLGKAILHAIADFPEEKTETLTTSDADVSPQDI